MIELKEFLLVKASEQKIEWDKIILEVRFTKTTVKRHIFYFKNENKFLFDVESKEYDFYTDLKWGDFDQKINEIERFNKIEFEIFPDGSFEENYSWDSSKEFQDKLERAKYFFQWLNETMMNRIFDYEIENNLLIPNYDEDGDLIDYQSSYDNGIFTFTMNDNSVSHEIELLKDGVSRKLSMTLPNYVEKALLEHFDMTNNDLRNEWDSWNKLVINCPHNSIPYDEWSDYVFYSLEEL